MTSNEATAVVREIEIAAPPETIFDYLTDPEKMVAWMGITAELDARSGGAFRVDIDGRNIMAGEYLAVDRPRRIVWSFGWDAQDNPILPGSTRVEIELTPQGQTTLVRLTHSGLPDAAAVEMHGVGWQHYLERLAIAASGSDPGWDAYRGEPPSEVNRSPS